MATFHYICYVNRVDRSLCQVVGVDLDDDNYFLNLVKMDMITGARLSWWVVLVSCIGRLIREVVPERGSSKVCWRVDCKVDWNVGWKVGRLK